METPNITILGGDMRQCYAAQYLHSLGWNVTCCRTPDFPYKSGIIQADSLTDALEHCRMILAPTPLTRDKKNLYQAETNAMPCPLDDLWDLLTSNHRLAVCNLPEKYRKTLVNSGCEILDFGNDAFFQNQNAALTAEGVLAEVIRCTPFALSSVNILLLGYGFCGAAISKLFLPMCGNIYLIEQDMKKQENARQQGLSPICADDFPHILPECRLVINTVPAPILDTAQLAQLHSSCHIFDIASSPFGFPADITAQCLLPHFRLPGIPGRFSPVTAGEMIGRTIERMAEHAL